MIYFYVLLLRVVAYLEGSQKILAFLLVFGFISYSTLKRIPLKTLGSISKYNFYAIALILLILIHGLIFGKVLIRDVAVLLTYWIWFMFTYTFLKQKTLRESLNFILITFFIFNLVNYVYFKLYFADQRIGYNSIMSMFGYLSYRIYFPLSSGNNIFTSQLSLNAIICLFFIKTSKRKIIYILIFFFYLLMLILADSRLLFGLTLFFSVIYWFSVNRILMSIKKYWWLIGIFFIAFMVVFYNTNIFDTFKRGGEIDGRALTRIEIWEIASKVIFSDLNFFIGNGLNGFENNLLDSAKETFEAQNLQTSHNFIIQNFIDFGVFGVVFILWGIYKILILIKKIKNQVLTILLVMLLLMGFTESIPSFYSFEPTLFFIALLSIIFIENERKNFRFYQSNNLLS